MSRFSRTVVLIPLLSVVAGLVLARGAEAQIPIGITKPGASVSGTVTLELHGGTPPLPGCTGIEACPGAGPHVIVAPLPVAVGPGTTAAALSTSLAAALTAAGAPTTAGPAGITITPPPGVTHCCVNSSLEDGGSGHSMVMPSCVVNNIADGVPLNGAMPIAGGFTFTKSQPVPALPAWGVSALVLLVVGGGAFLVSRMRV